MSVKSEPVTAVDAAGLPRPTDLHAVSRSSLAHLDSRRPRAPLSAADPEALLCLPCLTWQAVLNFPSEFCCIDLTFCIHLKRACVTRARIRAPPPSQTGRYSATEQVS